MAARARTARTPKKGARASHEAQLVPIASLKPYPGNARVHDLAVIRESLRVNGQYRPVVVRSRTRHVLAGNGTMQAALEEGWSELWATFVDVDAAAAKRINLVDNRANDLAGYDDEALAEQLRELPGVEGTGWSEREVVQFLARVDKEPNADTEPGEPPATPRTKPGGLWLLDEHRLLCADATVADDVARLMGGGVADMVLTDPPYGIDYAGKTSSRLTIVGDTAAGLEGLVGAGLALAAEHSAPGAAAYCFHSDAHGVLFRQAFEAAGFELKQVLVWVKQHFVLGRQDYNWQHEPILYGWKPGKHRWYGDFAQSTVADDDVDVAELEKAELVALVRSYREREQTTVLREDRPHVSEFHPTMKPVALCARILGNSSCEGQLVLDPFAGSGSTLIACENLSRRCYAMEIDPGYCDVIVDRWERHTGQKATRG